MLIIASLVEREAQLARERPLIASVIYNRLRDGMPLGIDATIRYDTHNWSRPLRVSELEADTPYNTRLRRGLPPTPIGNPGLASLKAAAKPARKDYLFFVRKPGDSGEHAFSSTNAEFERDVARYQASRGGPWPLPYLGVCGWPVAHSRSPQMHNAALAALGLDDWRYLRLPLPPELFEETVRALPAAGFRGVNVTIPHKEAALALADHASEAARAIGAANTLTFEDGAIHADNTDAPGLLAALGEDPAGRTALVLGAGGAGRAAAWALREAGADVAVWNRTPERARALAADLGVRAVDAPGPADIIVHCTSVGLQGPRGHVQGAPDRGR